MGSLYDTTMKREKMIHDFEQLLAQYRAYFKDADIDIDGKAPELMLYKEALRIYTSLPQMKNLDPLCIMEGEYDLLRSILSDMQTGNWITSPYYKKCHLIQKRVWPRSHPFLCMRKTRTILFPHSYIPL